MTPQFREHLIHRLTDRFKDKNLAKDILDCLNMDSSIAIVNCKDIDSSNDLWDKLFWYELRAHVDTASRPYGGLANRDRARAEVQDASRRMRRAAGR